MFTIVVIVFEVVAVIFIGAFGRADSLTSTYLSYIPSILSFYLAITVVYTPYRKFFLTPLINLLLTLSLSLQISLLFIPFWSYCFTGFASTSFPISGALLLKCLFSTLPSLLTSLDFLPLFDYWHYHFTTTCLMTMGYCLLQAILVNGLGIYDGGGGLRIFLYSGTCSLMLWFIALRGNIDAAKLKMQQSYLSYSLVVIGVVVAFMTWPSFNAAGAVTTYNTILAYSNSATTLATLTTLTNSATVNTFLGLSVTILLSFLFLMKEEKVKMQLFIDCFMNVLFHVMQGGIIMASYTDISINPAPAMVMTLTSTIITLITHKYLLTRSDSQSEQTFKFLLLNYSKVIYRVVWSLLGICISSIIIITRDSTLTTGLLLTNNAYSLKAGYSIVAFIVVLGVGLLFGSLNAAVIRYLYRSKTHMNEHISDVRMLEECTAQMYPLYPNSDQLHSMVPQSKPIDIHQYTSKIIKESLLRSNDVPLKQVRTQPIDQLKINKNYSKGNPDSNVSQMKIKDEQGVLPQPTNTAINRTTSKEPTASRVQQSPLNVRRKLDFSAVEMQQDKPIDEDDEKIQEENVPKMEIRQ